VLQVLEPIWYEKPETASRVRGRIESVIDYVAARHNLQIQNPARWKGHLDKLLPKKAKVKKVVHHKAVPWKDAAEVCAKIMARRGVAAQALQAVILTAARHSEVTGMRKSELLLEERIWIIPSERMKIPRDHFVPISDQFLALLLSVGAGEGNPDDLVFGSSQKQRKGQELSENTLTKVMQNNDIDATTHGWRSTFRDWAAETTHYPNELCEIALAHTIPNKAEAAYRRGDMLEKRRPLMQDWANYVMPK
jgi:integrase